MADSFKQGVQSKYNIDVEMLNIQKIGDVSKVTCPVLFITGMEDKLVD